MPPSQALTMTAPKKSEAGADSCQRLSMRRRQTVPAATATIAMP